MTDPHRKATEERIRAQAFSTTEEQSKDLVTFLSAEDLQSRFLREGGAQKTSSSIRRLQYGDPVNLPATMPAEKIGALMEITESLRNVPNVVAIVLGGLYARGLAGPTPIWTSPSTIVRRHRFQLIKCGSLQRGFQRLDQFRWLLAFTIEGLGSMVAPGFRVPLVKSIFSIETWNKFGRLSKRGTVASHAMTTINNRLTAFGVSFTSARLIAVFHSMTPKEPLPG
jgi:hypothetical protein